MVEQEPPLKAPLEYCLNCHSVSLKTKPMKRGKSFLGKAVPWLSKRPRLAADRFGMNREHPTTSGDRACTNGGQRRALHFSNYLFL